MIERQVDLIAQFFDELAPEYDDMTGYEKRLVKEKPFFHLLVDRYKIHSALDAGCGTGAHSIMLALLGVKVTAVDVSPAMVQRTAEHASKHGLDIATRIGSFGSLSKSIRRQFDGVFCLGNSLAHTGSAEEMQNSLQDFFLLLPPGGHLFVQMLNYELICAEKNRIQNVREECNKTFIRFYDFSGDLIQFNILTLTKERDDIRHHLQSISQRAIFWQEFEQALGRSGFEEIRLHGGISLGEFQPATSRDLVVIARRRV